ncbi:methyltransferase [Amycolatopsis sp. NPDC059021]|uniref:methyltransferase n=1 Tax=Amycolatopsis sp. NPDC059021 TaxID=3346704 RepID=UPI00366DB515
MKKKTTTADTGELTPAALMQLGSAFAHAKALLSAIELDLCTELGKGPRTEEQIRTALGLHPRVTWEWLSMLVALGVLERDGERYRNTPGSARFLDRSKPSYTGGFLERANRVLFPSWVHLTDALRTGEPQARHIEADDLFDSPYRKPEEVEAFLTMMDSLTSAIGPALAKTFDWSTVKSVVDVGGARGNLLSLVLAEHEHLTGTVFDLAPLAAPAARLAERAGLADRLHFHAGSFFEDGLPEADAMIIGHVLHDWDAAQRQVIVDKAFAAIRPGGSVLLYDSMLDADDPDLARLTISVHMKLMTPGGAEYTVAEGTEMLHRAGFTDVEPLPLGALDTLLVARKPE